MVESDSGYQFGSGIGEDEVARAHSGGGFEAAMADSPAAGLTCSIGGLMT